METAGTIESVKRGSLWLAATGLFSTLIGNAINIPFLANIGTPAALLGVLGWGSAKTVESFSK